MAFADRLHILLTNACLPMVCMAALLSSPRAAAQTVETALATRYPRDIGIGTDSHVLFADDFEKWRSAPLQHPAGTWDAIRNSRIPNQQQTVVINGSVRVGEQVGPGQNILKLACWHSSPNSAGLRKDLGNYRNQNEGRGVGYEEVFIRYYQKLDSEYRPERNHGSNVGGRDLTQAECWWCGMANTTDVASHGYFYSGLQPYYDDRFKKLYWGFYSYHMTKPTPWGDDYKPTAHEKKAIEPGR